VIFRIFVRYKNLDRFLSVFFTMPAFDRQTDGRIDRRTDSFLIARPRVHAAR